MFSLDEGLMDGFPSLVLDSDFGNIRFGRTQSVTSEVNSGEARGDCSPHNREFDDGLIERITKPIIDGENSKPPRTISTVLRKCVEHQRLTAQSAPRISSRIKVRRVWGS